MNHAPPVSGSVRPSDGRFEAALLTVLAELWHDLELAQHDPGDVRDGVDALVRFRLELLVLADTAERLLCAGRLAPVQAFRMGALVRDLLATLSRGDAVATSAMVAAQNQILDEVAVLVACQKTAALQRERATRCEPPSADAMRTAPRGRRHASEIAGSPVAPSTAFPHRVAG